MIPRETMFMSGRARGRYRRKGRPQKKDFSRKTCKECRRYSRKTFYCVKWLKVLDQDRRSCMYFSPRRGSRNR